jgi:BlaI family penicillinase repressor
MGSLPQISDAEWEIMQITWKKSPITAAEIIAEVAGRTAWNHRTVRTLLNRLVRKGALGFEAIGNRYSYHPRVSRESCVRAESRSFIQKVFSGDTASLVVHFVRNGRLSADDVQELKRILHEKKREVDQ